MPKNNDHSSFFLAILSHRERKKFFSMGLSYFVSCDLSGPADGAFGRMVSVNTLETEWGLF